MSVVVAVHVGCAVCLHGGARACAGAQVVVPVSTASGWTSSRQSIWTAVNNNTYVRML